MQDQRRIARLMRDISEIKAAVKRNSPVLREIVTARYYWLHLLAFGAAVVVFSVIMHFLVRGYGGYAAIPAVIKTVFWIAAAAVGASIYVYRVSGVLRTVKSIDKRLTFWSLLGDHDIGEFMHIYVPIAAISMVATIYLSRAGESFYIIAVWAGCLGLTINLVAFAAHLAEFYVGGYWTLVTGALSIFVPGISASLWIAICFGGGDIAYVVFSGLFGRRGGRRVDGNE